MFSFSISSRKAIENINELALLAASQSWELQEIHSLTPKVILSVRTSKGRVQIIYT